MVSEAEQLVAAVEALRQVGSQLSKDTDVGQGGRQVPVGLCRRLRDQVGRVVSRSGCARSLLRLPVRVRKSAPDRHCWN